MTQDTPEDLLKQVADLNFENAELKARLQEIQDLHTQLEQVLQQQIEDIDPSL